MAYQDQLFVH
jgi:hypothetical protein